jgi:hypothetical protein
MKFMCSAAVAALLALGAGVDSADAAVVVSLDGSSAQGGSNGAGLAFAQGYGANTPDDAIWTGIQTVTGNSSGNWQSPFNSNGLTNVQSYFSANPSATLTFGTAQSEFTLLWGSIDSYNTIEFLSGNTVIGSKTGTDVINQFALGGSPANFEKVGLFTFAFDQGETFDGVRFLSSQAAFEFALAPAPVPLPAAGWMLVAGIAGLGAAARKRKQA